jgi:hypothetical protein
MFKLLSSLPLFIWPLFVLLLMGGLKARKTGFVPLKMLLIIPAAFLTWSLISFFGKYGGDLASAALWFLCLGCGFLIGFAHIRRIKPKVDREKQRLELPGSWIPLVLSMSIFFAKSSIGAIKATAPHLEGSILCLLLELFAAIILGVFAGRGIGCLARYRAKIYE